MSRAIRTLLFATNPSEECRPALETARFFAEQFGVGVVLLHVVDRALPSQVDEHFKGVLGEKKWEALKKEHEQDAREALIGKMTSGKIVEKAMKDYRSETGIDTGERNVSWQEVVIEDKNVGRAILDQAKAHGCDLIVLGSRKGFISGNAVGTMIRHVMGKADIPVMVVPKRSKTTA